MKNEAWEKFQRTGKIDDYLAYKNAVGEDGLSMVMTAKNKTQDMEKDERKTSAHRDGASGSSRGGF